MGINKGKLIVAEGIDTSGKTSLGKGIIEYLDEELGPTLYYENISTGPIGVAIRQCLRKENYLHTNRQIIALYTSELYAVAKEIKRMLDKGINVVCSRWLFSTITYATDNVEEVKYLLSGYDDLEIYPDLVIQMNIQPRIMSERLAEKYKGEHDHFEQEEKLLDVTTKYMEIAPAIKASTNLINLDGALKLSTNICLFKKHFEELDFNNNEFVKMNYKDQYNIFKENMKCIQKHC